MKKTCKSIFRRTLSFMVTAAMCLSLLPISAFAAEDAGQLSDEVIQEEVVQTEQLPGEEDTDLEGTEIFEPESPEEVTEDQQTKPSEDGEETEKSDPVEDEDETQQTEPSEVEEQPSEPETAEGKGEEGENQTGKPEEPPSDDEEKEPVADHVHNEDGWSCVWSKCIHEHSPECYVPGEDGEDVLNCAHVCGEKCLANQEGTWTCTAPEESGEDQEPVQEEIPAEVQAFLDAVAAIPEITPENAMEAAEYLYGPVSEAYEALLGTEYEGREDVKEAAAAYAAAVEAVDAALNVESDTLENNTNSLFGRDYHIDDKNVVDELDGKTLNLNIKVGVGEKVIDEGVFRFWDMSYGVYNVYSWDDFDIWSTNESVLKVTAVPNGKSLKIIYEGIADGTAQVKMAFNLTTKSTGEGSVWGSDNWGAAACANCTVGTATVGNGGTPDPDEGKPTTKPNANNIYVRMFCDSYTNGYAHYGKAGYLSSHTDKWSLGDIVPCDWLNGYDWFCPLNMDMNKWTSFYNQNYGTHMFSMYYHSPTTSPANAMNNPIPSSELGFYWDGSDWLFYSGYLYIAMTEYSSQINYTVVHEYYTNGEFDGSISESKTNAQTGTKIYPADLTKKTTYNNETYEYKSGTPNPLICCNDVTANVITLRYERETASDKTTYRVVREYYVDGEKVARSIGGNTTGTVGQEIVGAKLAAENPDWVYYTIDGQKLEFEYKDSYEGKYIDKNLVVGNKADSITLTDNVMTNVIVLRYERNTPIDNDKVNVTKTPSEEYPMVGEEFTYTIEVENGNSVALENVTITDVLNPALDFVSATDGGTYNKETRTVTWTNVTVPANRIKQVELTVKANKSGKIYNEANVTWRTGSSSGNTTVTAKDPEYTYMLTYHENAGDEPVESMPIPNPDSVTNTTATSHKFTVSDATPTRENYTFAGWNTQADGKGTTYTAKSEIEATTANPNLNLYAQWTPTYKYTLTYDANGGNQESVPEKQTEGPTTEITHNFPVDSTTVPTRENYKFLGWYKDAEGTGDKVEGTVTATKENPDITLYAKWEGANNYELIYHANGDEVTGMPANEKVEKSEKLKHDFIVNDAEPTRQGYIFKGWNDKNDGMGTKYEANETITATKEEPVRHLYAQWSPLYTVSYTWTGLPEGTTNPTEPTDNNRYEKDAQVTVDTEFIQGKEIDIDGITYIFSGWKAESITVEDGKFTMPGKNVELKGEWTAKEYTVTYSWSGLPENHTENLPIEPNHGKGQTVSVDVEYPIGKEITIGEGENAVTYVFSGWSTSDAEVGEDRSFIMPGKDVTITGTWTEKQPEPINPTPTPTPTPEPTPTPDYDPDPDPDPEPDPDPTPVRRITVNTPDNPTPLTEIADTPVPQSDTIDIFDDDVPLAGGVNTGNNDALWYLLAALSLAGLGLVKLLEKKSKSK